MDDIQLCSKCRQEIEVEKLAVVVSTEGREAAPTPTPKKRKYCPIKYAQNRKKYAEYHARHYSKKRKEYLQKAKDYYEQHKEEIKTHHRVYFANYYRANRDKLLAKNRAMYLLKKQQKATTSDNQDKTI